MDGIRIRIISKAPEVRINGIKLKAIQCNSCSKYLGFFQDVRSQIDELKEQIDGLESDMSDLT